jgi:hypothetical protein
VGWRPSDEASQRRYNGRRPRFDQPDPYEGSYDLSDPQSFNRYCIGDPYGRDRGLYSNYFHPKVNERCK